MYERLLHDEVLQDMRWQKTKLRQSNQVEAKSRRTSLREGVFRCNSAFPSSSTEICIGQRGAEVCSFNMRSCLAVSFAF